MVKNSASGIVPGSNNQNNQVTGTSATVEDSQERVSAVLSHGGNLLEKERITAFFQAVYEDLSNEVGKKTDRDIEKTVPLTVIVDEILSKLGKKNIYNKDERGSMGSLITHTAIGLIVGQGNRSGKKFIDFIAENSTYSYIYSSAPQKKWNVSDKVVDELYHPVLHYNREISSLIYMLIQYRTYLSETLQEKLKVFPNIEGRSFKEYYDKVFSVGFDPTYIFFDVLFELIDDSYRYFLPVNKVKNAIASLFLGECLVYLKEQFPNKQTFKTMVNMLSTEKLLSEYSFLDICVLFSYHQKRFEDHDLLEQVNKIYPDIIGYYYGVEKISKREVDQLNNIGILGELMEIPDEEKRQKLGHLILECRNIFFKGTKVIFSQVLDYIKSKTSIEEYISTTLFFQNAGRVTSWHEKEILFVLQHRLVGNSCALCRQNIQILMQDMEEGILVESQLSGIDEEYFKFPVEVTVGEEVAYIKEGDIDEKNILEPQENREEEEYKKLHQVFTEEEVSMIAERVKEESFDIIVKIGKRLTKDQRESFVLYFSLSEKIICGKQLQGIFRMIEFFGKFDIYSLPLQELVLEELEEERINYIFTYVWKRGGIERIDDWEEFQNMILEYLKSGDNHEIRQYLQKVAFLKLSPSHKIDKYILSTLRLGDQGKIDNLAESIDEQMRSLYEQMDPAKSSSRTNTGFGVGTGRFTRQFRKHVFSQWYRADGEKSEEYLFRIGAMNLGEIFQHTEFKKGDISKLGTSLPNERKSFTQVLLNFSNVILKCESMSRKEVNLRPLNNYYMSIVKSALENIQQSL